MEVRINTKIPYNRHRIRFSCESGCIGYRRDITNYLAFPFKFPKIKPRQREKPQTSTVWGFLHLYQSQRTNPCQDMLGRIYQKKKRDVNAPDTSGAGAGGCSISRAYAIGRLTANGRVTWLASGACNRCNHFAYGAVHRPIAFSAALEHPPAPAPRN